MNHLLVFFLIFVSYLSWGRNNLRDWLLACGMISLPFGYDFTVLGLTSVESFHGWTAGILIRLSDIFMALLIAHEYANPQRQKVRMREIVGFSGFVLFFIASALSMSVASHRDYAFVALLEIGKDFFLYGYALLYFLLAKGDFDLILRSLAISLAFQGLLGVLQYVFQDFYAVFRTGGVGRLTYHDLVIRSHGTLGQPNGYASFLVPVILLLFATWLNSKCQHRKLYLGSFLLGCLGLLFSLSRGGWIAFAAGIGLIILIRALHPSQSKGNFKILVAFFLVCLVLAPFIHERLSGADNGAAEDRIWLAKNAWNIIDNNWLLGVGLNNYRFAMYQYLPADYDWSFIYRVHNLFLLVFAETGIMGVIGIIIIFFIPFRLAIRQFRQAAIGDLRLLGIAAAIFAMVLQNIPDTGWSVASLNSLYFVLIAMITYLFRLQSGPDQTSCEITSDGS